jgi:hexosaminidase
MKTAKICRQLLPLLLISLPFIVQCTDDLSNAHRVFPAAQVEMYEAKGDILGIVKRNALSISVFGPVDVHKVTDPAIRRFQESLERLPDFKEEYEGPPDGFALHDIQMVEIHVKSPDMKLYQGVEESYDIVINDTSSLATLRAPTVFGALHALETLTQLLEFGWIEAGEPVFVIRGIPLVIADQPSFEFRGLMIDTGRHYLPINLILANLDAMAMNKMNVLHWHLVDRESFPYQTKSYPEIAEKGAYHPKRIYTTKDIQTVIDEAYLRGIRVIPEIDMPGHTNAIAKSHPELMSHCPLPSEPVDPTNPDIYGFVETIYKDLKDLFPDEYVHVGGDEVNFDCWAKSKKISKWMKQHNMTDTVDLYEYFETRLLRIVDKLDKTPIVWQEVFNLNLTIPKNTIVDVWKGFDRETVEQATNQSFRVILSGCWYLDHLNQNWKDFYDCNPKDFNGTVELMLGGHASIWGESVDASNFMSRVWPRASATAERLWTGDVSNGAEKTIFERIRQFRCRMVQRGFAAGPTEPGSCPHEVPYLHDWGKDKHCTSEQTVSAVLS